MSSAVGDLLAYPTILYPPCSDLVNHEAWSAIPSTWIFLIAPVEPPHQFATGAKSRLAFGTRAVILNGPVATRPSGVVHQVSSPLGVPTFWSMTQETPPSARAESHQPAGAESLATNV